MSKIRFMWTRIKFTYWFHFKACRHEKSLLDALTYGSGVVDEGNRKYIPLTKFGSHLADLLHPKK